VSKPIYRSPADLARAAQARRLIAEGKLHPLDALDLMTSPTEAMRQAESQVGLKTLKQRAWRDI
jgi:hypothetical protein